MPVPEREVHPGDNHQRHPGSPAFEIRNSSIDEFIDYIVISEEAKSSKPSRGIFEYACDLTKVHDKEKIIIIGISLTRISRVAWISGRYLLAQRGLDGKRDHDSPPLRGEEPLGCHELSVRGRISRRNWESADFRLDLTRRER